MTKPERLAAYLTAEGVYFASVVDAGGVPSILYPADATQAQRDAGSQALAAYDYSDAAQEAADLADARARAGADILSGATPVHVSARGADAAVWTYGVNHLLEYFTARFALAAGGNWAPTAAQVAAQIAAARLTPAGVVDADAPTPADVASLMTARGRLAQADIVGLTQQLVQAGGGDPITQ